jgi:hypothetical protein
MIHEDECAISKTKKKYMYMRRHNSSPPDFLKKGENKKNGKEDECSVLGKKRK